MSTSPGGGANQFIYLTPRQRSLAGIYDFNGIFARAARSPVVVSDSNVACTSSGFPKSSGISTADRPILFMGLLDRAWGGLRKNLTDATHRRFNHQECNRSYRNFIHVRPTVRVTSAWACL